MAKQKSLQEIKRLFLRRKYSDVVRLLEPEVYRFRESFQYYALLGLSCLYLQDSGGAFSYLNRALQIKEDDITALLGIAAVHLKKRNLDEALKIWLRVLEISPGNKTARRGLDRVRRGMSEEAISHLVDSGTIRKFFPTRPVAVSPVFFIVLVIGLATAAGIFILVREAPALLAGINLITATPSPSPARPEIVAVELSGTALRTDARAKARYTFTDAQVDRIWKTAKDSFMAYRDNLAVVELNRLLNSNASLYIKENARRLKNFARTPEFKDFVNFRDNYPFETVSRDPLLYDGCYVLWRGTIANLFIGKTEIKFQFLVGSWDNRLFEGAVPVIFDHADKFENNYYLELLGKVVAGNDSYYLKGVLNRRLIAGPPDAK
jgi:tetratricopeptide (TPR) repeat protein